MLIKEGLVHNIGSKQCAAIDRNKRLADFDDEAISGKIGAGECMGS